MPKRNLVSILVLTAIAASIVLPLAVPLEAVADQWRRDGSHGFAPSYNPVQDTARCSAVFNGKLYVGATGYMYAGQSQVWRYDGSGWTRASTDGFGDPRNTGACSMAVMGGYLYVGTEVSGGGAQVWRTTGAGGTPSWQKVSSPGNTEKEDNNAASVMAVTAAPSRLYVGTENYQGCEIWRYDGASWTACVGPTAAVGAGFGDPLNTMASAMAVSPAGEVFVGTRHISPGCEVWRGSNLAWTRANTDGFGDTRNVRVDTLCFFGGSAFAGTDNSQTGAEVFQYAGAPGTAWNRRNTDGFGAAANRSTVGSVVYGGKLYMATYNPTLGTTILRYDSAGPPAVWTAVSNAGFGQADAMFRCFVLCSFNGSLFAAPSGRNGCIVYRAGGTASTPYTWTALSTRGFTSNANDDALASATFKGKLYVGTGSFRGCEVWRLDATGWTRVNDGGFGSMANEAVLSMASHGGYLYAGTLNYQGCEVWRYDGSSWASISASGFGNAGTREACSMVVFNNKLFVGTSSYNAPYACVWRFDGPGAANWKQVNKNGFGSSKHVAAASLAVHSNKLYAGTFSSNDPCAVFRWDGSGVNWTQVNTLGFGKAETSYASRLASYGGKLYCAAYNRTMHGVEVWRYAGSGTSWAQVNSNGFGNANNSSPGDMTVFSNLLYVSTINHKDGAEVWSFNGSKWSKAGTKGLGSVLNSSIDCLREHAGRLYAGTANRDRGCEVWSTGGMSNAWYLAEGSSAWGFSTYITVENPNATPTTANVTYMTTDGAVSGGTLNLAARSQATINPTDKVGARDFSTLVTCTEFKRLAVDRTMYWNAGSREEAHASIGVTSPSCTWYLPEGSSAWGFECWLLIQNPGSTPATCAVTYMIEGEGPVTKSKAIPAGARQSFNIADDIGQRDSSIMIVSDVPVIPERAMYRNDRGEGHDSIGTTAAARDFYLAEGTSAWGFTTYVLVQNPNASEADVTVTYMTPAGARVQPAFKMPANSRKTIRVNDVLPDSDFSTKVSANVPVIAERSMYWNNGTGEACHDSIGLAEPHSAFYLPDGETSNGRETWTLVQNPNAGAVTIEIAYMTPTGVGNVTFQDSIPANSRRTYAMSDRIPGGRAAISVVSKTAGRKIMVERAMYWNGRGAGTDTIGGYSD